LDARAADATERQAADSDADVEIDGVSRVEVDDGVVVRAGTRFAPALSRQLAATFQSPPAGLIQLTAVTAASQGENSEVLPAGSVAVAVTLSFAAMAAGSDALKGASPLASVVTEVAPRKRCPSPWPEGSQAALAKNSMV
jgi:hypothetical protein